jgi:AcrR family transcriptional regulator
VTTAARASAREALLDAAERLFAQHGVAETSVRAITAAAGANVAAVNYYFGSREGLIERLLARRLEPLNQVRLRMLEERAPRTPAEVLHALAGPALDLCFEHPNFARLASRLRADTDPSVWEQYRLHQAGFVATFQAALAATRPDLDAEESARRLHYVLGAIHHVWAHAPLPRPRDEVVASFLTFYGAALDAPPPSSSA